MEEKDPWDDYPSAVLDVELAPRLAPAAVAVRSLLSDGKWHSHVACVAVALDASDIVRASVAAIICQLVKAGAIEKTGVYRQRGVDDRKYMIKDWTT